MPEFHAILESMKALIFSALTISGVLFAWLYQRERAKNAQVTAKLNDQANVEKTEKLEAVVTADNREVQSLDAQRSELKKKLAVLMDAVPPPSDGGKQNTKPKP